MVDEANEMLKKSFVKIFLLCSCFLFVGCKWFCCQTSYFQKNQDIIKNEFSEEKINKCGIGCVNCKCMYKMKARLALTWLSFKCGDNKK